MPTLFDLLREEIHPTVRIVLGHFFFVYIHPYMDGNGRAGRVIRRFPSGLTKRGIAGDPPPHVPNKERLAALNELAAYDEEIGI